MKRERKRVVENEDAQPPTKDELGKLPALFLKEMQYSLGCNCLCNSIFVLSFLRLLAKNKYLGKYSHHEYYDLVSGETLGNYESDHAFLKFSVEKTKPELIDKYVCQTYLECTIGWAYDYYRYGKNVYKMDYGDDFKSIVSNFIQKLIGESHDNIDNYHFTIIPPSRCFMTVFANEDDGGKKFFHEYYTNFEEYTYKLLLNHKYTIRNNDYRFTLWFEEVKKYLHPSLVKRLKPENAILYEKYSTVTHRIIASINHYSKFYSRCTKDKQLSIRRDLEFEFLGISESDEARFFNVNFQYIKEEITKGVTYKKQTIKDAIKTMKSATPSDVNFRNMIVELANKSQRLYNW